MIYIDKLIRRLEEYRYKHKFKYTLTIVSETHISLCIVSNNKSDSAGCFDTKHFMMPITKARIVDEHEAIKYIIDKFGSD